MRPLLFASKSAIRKPRIQDDQTELPCQAYGEACRWIALQVTTLRHTACSAMTHMDEDKPDRHWRRRNFELIALAALLVRQISHEDQEIALELEEIARRLETVSENVFLLDRDQTGDNDR
ncbi:MAG: hypothetical protein ACR2QF_07380 [Geminicoccaceae bacterium]